MSWCDFFKAIGLTDHIKLCWKLWREKKNMITKVNAENLKSFMTSEKLVLILCDAEWNNRKELSEQFKELASERIPGTAFGEADAGDEGLFEFFKEWKVLNVPTIVYIWNDLPMTKTGNHNIKEQIEEMN